MRKTTRRHQWTSLQTIEKPSACRTTEPFYEPSGSRIINQAVYGASQALPH
jgi:hypothetical protein